MWNVFCCLLLFLCFQFNKKRCIFCFELHLFVSYQEDEEEDEEDEEEFEEEEDDEEEEDESEWDSFEFAERSRDVGASRAAWRERKRKRA